MEKDKKTGRRSFFNVFDIVVLAIVVALAVFLFLAREGLGERASKKNVIYVVEFTAVHENMVPLIQKGDVLVDKIKKFSAGTVEKVEVFPAENYISDLVNGGLVKVEEPHYNRVLVTLSAEADVTDMEVMVDNGFPIRVGLGVVLRGPGYEYSGFIIEMNRGELE